MLRDSLIHWSQYTGSREIETKPKPEKRKQDKSKLDNTVHCYKISLGWQRGTISFWVAFSPVLGPISLMERRHPCREATGTATATLVEPALTIVYICTYFFNWSELRVRDFTFFYTTLPMRLHDPLKINQIPQWYSNGLIHSVQGKEQCVSVQMVCFSRGLCDLSN